MNNEIKQILEALKSHNDIIKEYPLTLSIEEQKLLLDYITNLQEKSNNQAEEINRLYKQRKKFMKKYGYLKEENEKLTAESTECESKYYEADNDRHKLFEQKEKAIEYINKLLKTDDIPLVDVILMTIKEKLGSDEE